MSPALKHKIPLFAPGAGRPPPYLAGRDREKRYMGRALHTLKSKRPATKNIVMTGPRGCGKTALLHWFDRSAADSADVLWATPDRLQDGGQLASLMVPESIWEQIKGRISGVGLPGGLRFEMVRGAPGDSRITNVQEAAILRRCHAKPLILVVDEAHVLHLEVGRSLLNMTQNIQRLGAPFLLALAGTPNLSARLTDMNASFWSRCEQMGIGRLAPNESSEALRRPLGEKEVLVDGKTLVPGLREAQDYPYFIQELGDALWEALPSEGGCELTPKQMTAALPRLREAQTGYYEVRRSELHQRQLIPAALATSAAFAGKQELSYAELEDALRATKPEANRDRALEWRTALSDLGYIWKDPKKTTWEPGIPSLMKHILDHDRPKTNR